MCRCVYTWEWRDGTKVKSTEFSSVLCIYTSVPVEARREGIGPSEMTVGYEQTCRCYELNLGSLQQSSPN